MEPALVEPRMKGNMIALIPWAFGVLPEANHSTLYMMLLFAG